MEGISTRGLPVQAPATAGIEADARAAGACVVMLGPSPEARGGIASVVAAWQAAGLFRRWPVLYLRTHAEDGRWAKWRTAFGAWFRFLGLLAGGRVACLHAHVARYNSFWRKAAFILPALALGRPVLVHLHSGGFPRFYEECGPWRRRLIRFVLDRAAALVVLSPAWHGMLAAMTDNRRVAVVGNFVEPAAEPRTQTARKRQVLFLGRLTRDKGFYDLLEAAVPLCRLFPDLEIACGGDGDVYAAADRIRTLGLDGRVRLLGWVRGEEKERWLRQACVLALPSYVEGIPLCVLEAMAHGVPVVASRVGGIPEVVEDGRAGLLFEAGDVESLRRHLWLLLRDPDTRGWMGANARRRVRARYSAAAVLPALERLYGDYLSDRQSP
jgi:glycosyltransferase involved in cell wall biosynthesis